MKRRNGSLREWRYKASPIDTDVYLLSCCRYVELNPVKARMVESLEAYPWSSYSVRAGLAGNDWLDEPQVKNRSVRVFVFKERTD